MQPLGACGSWHRTIMCIGLALTWLVRGTGCSRAGANSRSRCRTAGCPARCSLLELHADQVGTNCTASTACTSIITYVYAHHHQCLTTRAPHTCCSSDAWQQGAHRPRAGCWRSMGSERGPAPSLRICRLAMSPQCRSLQRKQQSCVRSFSGLRLHWQRSGNSMRRLRTGEPCSALPVAARCSAAPCYPLPHRCLIAPTPSASSS